MKFKEFLKKFAIILVFVKIATSIMVFYCIYWAGLKGAIGFVIGTTVTSLIMLTKNPLAKLLIQVFEGNENVMNYLKTGERDEEEYVEVNGHETKDTEEE